jgi:hypothetical protein
MLGGIVCRGVRDEDLEARSRPGEQTLVAEGDRARGQTYREREEPLHRSASDSTPGQGKTLEPDIPCNASAWMLDGVGENGRVIRPHGRWTAGVLTNNGGCPDTR